MFRRYYPKRRIIETMELSFIYLKISTSL